jgi:hypothetical protein
MANFASAVTLYGQDTFTSSATQMHPLGTRGYTSDGRRFRYAQVGATDTVAGSLYQGAAPVTAHLANTPPVVAIGAKSFVYTPGAAAGAANLYAEGYLQVDTAGSGAPNGYTYQVSGHAAIASSTAFTLNLVDPIQVALATSSRVGLMPNAFKNVIVAATTVTAAAVGVAPTVIADVEYGWLQTWGPCSALINGTPGVGIGLVSSATTAGAFDVAAVAAEINVRILARMMQVGVSTKNNFVFLQID